MLHQQPSDYNVFTVGSELSGPDWDEDELHPRPEMNSCEEPQRTHGLHQQLSPPGEMEELFKDQDHDEVDDGEESEENVLQGCKDKFIKLYISLLYSD